MESQVNTAIVARLQATDPALMVQDSGYDQPLARFPLRLFAFAASPFAALSFAALFAALPLQLCTRSSLCSFAFSSFGFCSFAFALCICSSLCSFASALQMHFALPALHFQLLCLQLCHCILVLMCMYTGPTLILQRVFAKALCCIEPLQTLFAEHLCIFSRRFQMCERRGPGSPGQGRAAAARGHAHRTHGLRPAAAAAALRPDTQGVRGPCPRCSGERAGTALPGAGVQFSSSSVREGSSSSSRAHTEMYRISPLVSCYSSSTPRKAAKSITIALHRN